MSGLTAYERARLENIARNNDELRRLGLTRLPAPEKKTRGRKKAAGKRKAAAAQGTLRRSTRHKGKAQSSTADASVEKTVGERHRAAIATGAMRQKAMRRRVTETE